MSDETPTPVPITTRQPSGSINIAEAYRADCLRMADRLEERARLRAMASGAPALPLHRVARRLREVARNVEAWHSPPPGYAPRTSAQERSDDLDDISQWYQAGHDALESHPAP